MNFFHLYCARQKKTAIHKAEKKQGLVLGVLAPAVSGRGVDPDDRQGVGGDEAVLQRLLDVLQPHRHAAPHLLGRGEVVSDLQKHH